PYPPALSHSWERGRLWRIYPKSLERGNEKDLGTSCPKAGYFSISFFLSGLPSSGGCFSFHSSSRARMVSFISRGVLSLPKYFSSSALLMITLSTSFFC